MRELTRTTLPGYFRTAAIAILSGIVLTTNFRDEPLGAILYRNCYATKLERDGNRNVRPSTS